LKEETGLPIHLHTHDTSGIAGATILAAIDAGVDAIDGAMDAMSGTTVAADVGLDRWGLGQDRDGHRP